MAKKNRDYWKQRFEALEDEQYQRGAAYYRDLQEQFRMAINDIQLDIGHWYQRLADNQGISLAGAKRLLKKGELKEFRWTVEQYIKAGEEHALNGQWLKELENASARHHISYLETMKLQLQQHVELLSVRYEGGMDEFLHRSYSDCYYRAAYEWAKGTGVGTNLARPDVRKIDKLLRTPWAQDGKNFSDRIWENKRKLTNTLHTELAQSLIRGGNPRQAIDRLAKTMEVSKRQASRLVMTESAAIASAAQKDCLEFLGIDRYEIVATLDSKTSEICRSMDGKVFPMEDYEAGLTAPPFHPNCRTTTAPYFDDEFTEREKRAARDSRTNDTVYVPADMTYREWEKEFVGQEGGEKGAGEPKSMENSERMGYNVRTQEELEKAAQQVREGLPAYTKLPSKWSGTLIVDDSLSKTGVYGEKRWSCDIAVVSGADDGVLWHEMLHSCSVSHYGVETYELNQRIEEAAVEFLTQEICHETGIPHEKSGYDSMIDVLRTLNQSFEYGTDLEFAKELFQVPLPERFTWLMNRVDESLRQLGASFEDYYAVMEYVDYLKGGDL